MEALYQHLETLNIIKMLLKYIVKLIIKGSCQYFRNKKITKILREKHESGHRDLRSRKRDIIFRIRS